MLAKQYGPWAVILGGSEGVGVSFARKLAAEGINLVLVARKPEPLEVLADAVRADFHVEVRTLSADLVAVDTALEQVRALTDDVEVGMLIYNAGTDNKSSDFLDRSFEGAERTIALNAIGQAKFSYHFAAKMRERGRGGILTISHPSPAPSPVSNRSPPCGQMLHRKLVCGVKHADSDTSFANRVSATSQARGNSCSSIVVVRAYSGLGTTPPSMRSRYS